jgi:transcriptional regulator with XRE-family HTH domain
MARMTTTGLTPIGDVVRAWRKFRGFSSTKLADKAGVRLSYLSEIEHNRTINPREEYLEKLALALEVPLEDILGRRMPPVSGDEGGNSRLKQEEREDGGKQGAPPSAVFHAPLPVSHQKILLHRLAVAEKKLQATGKMVNELYEEIREIGALVADLQNEE